MNFPKVSIDFLKLEKGTKLCSDIADGDLTSSLMSVLYCNSQSKHLLVSPRVVSVNVNVFRYVIVVSHYHSRTRTKRYHTTVYWSSLTS